MPRSKRLLTRRKGAERRTASIRQAQAGVKQRADIDADRVVSVDSQPPTLVESHESTPTSSTVGLAPATPLKLLSPSSFKMAEKLSPISPQKAPSAEYVSIPTHLPQWKLHNIGSKIYMYRLMTEGIPAHCPPIIITHILSFDEGRWQLWEHVYLTSFSRMRVDLAAQVT